MIETPNSQSNIDQQNANSASQARTTVELLDDGASFLNGVLVPTGEQYEEIRDTRDYEGSVKKMGELSISTEESNDSLGYGRKPFDERELPWDWDKKRTEVEKVEELRVEIRKAVLDNGRDFIVHIPYAKRGEKLDADKIREVRWQEMQRHGLRDVEYDYLLAYSRDGYGDKIHYVDLGIILKGDKYGKTTKPGFRFGFEAGDITSITSQGPGMYNPGNPKNMEQIPFDSSDRFYKHGPDNVFYRALNDETLSDDPDRAEAVKFVADFYTDFVRGENFQLRFSDHEPPSLVVIGSKIPGNLISRAIPATEVYRYEYNAEQDAFVFIGEPKMIGGTTTSHLKEAPKELSMGTYLKLVKGTLACILSMEKL